ncbi:MAG: hypothetical protein WC848_01655 [Parcubacteria group bacterium]|jgi:hypothetical protein
MNDICCGECGIFRGSRCSLEKRSLAGDCPLYPEIPTILDNDKNPKCTKARAKGDPGVFSWGYVEIATSKGNTSCQKIDEVVDLVTDTSPEEKSCLKCKGSWWLFGIS